MRGLAWSFFGLLALANAAPRKALNPSLSTRAEPLRNPISPVIAKTKCMGIVGGIYANGSQVDIFDCNHSISQLWQLVTVASDASALSKAYHSTPANSLDEFCLDAGNVDELANGVKVKIWKCFDGLPQQSWIPLPSGQITLSVGGFCLDLTDGITTNRNVLQVWECVSGNQNQIWLTDPTLNPVH